MLVQYKDNTLSS